jgi:hypothetical protein
MQTTFNGNTSWEKNWSIVKYDSKLCVVYSWYPVKICAISNSSISVIKETESPSFFENVRGSTNGVIHNGEIWFVAHVNKKGEYFHIFIVFDLGMELKRYSDFFKFENESIEFCLGLVINKSFILSYSTNDCTSKLMILDSLPVAFHCV